MLKFMKISRTELSDLRTNAKKKKSWFRCVVFCLFLNRVPLALRLQISIHMHVSLPVLTVDSAQTSLSSKNSMRLCWHALVWKVRVTSDVRGMRDVIHKEDIEAVSP